ncbi:MAG: dihydropteroate synthase [Planctomycetes bacterium]|nr:dihydropteroate synthase [Planctomycetota bacterium]NBY03710.1 dihydropteroate synthase [Planctomycetota bacterium]
MGILNVTPDSFSDGGTHFTIDSAVDHALRMEDQGADIIDIGGESTRPGAIPVSLEDEKARVLPVVEKLASRLNACISIDTTKCCLAEAAIDLGAHIINDISALTFDPGMLELAGKKNCGWIIMHIKGTPANMQQNPCYDDVVSEVSSFLSQRFQIMVDAGVDPLAVSLDPGIGFGKTFDHNLELITGYNSLKKIGLPVCLGVSRKKFLQTLLGRKMEERLAGTLAVLAYSLLHDSAQIFRVHDVIQARDLVTTIKALESFTMKQNLF